MSNLSRLLLLSLTFPLVMQPAFGGERIQEATKRLQIAYDVDVVIAGGSVPAVAAAVAVARKGHSVFLLTDRPYLGEDVCMHLAYLMPEKTEDPLLKALWGGETKTTPMQVKRGLDQALLDSDVKFLTGCYPAEVLLGKNGRVSGITIVNRSGRQVIKVPLQIIDGQYKSEALRLDPGKVTLSKKDLQRVAREKKEIQRIYANSSDSRLWYGSFEKPLDGDTTSAFGTQRLLNGQLRSQHRGTDFRASVGTPVKAANSGIVRLARNLFYSGNIVIVDHGMGIFTNYAHLSKIEVIEGQYIARGDPIGLAGSTGRVSGPHLHWGVKVSGAYVDPMQFLTVISSLLAP